MQDFKDVSFSGFKDETIAQIKQDCLRFANFKFSPDFEDKDQKFYMEIDGSVFNNNNTYFIYRIKDGLSVQVTPKPRNPICYEYGFHIFTEDNLIKFLVFHHGHGPFN
jgi:hypothetical protein